MSMTLAELRGPALCEGLLPVAAAAFPDADGGAAAARRRPALHALLDETLALPPEYQDGLTNHLPMALHALDALGADEARLRDFAARYVQRFVEREDAAPVAVPTPPGDGWIALRGRFDAFDALRAAFGQALARDGADAVLRRALPLLMDGVAAQAFHGPIRVAHAAEAGHAGELAAGLAYWAARWQPLAAPDAPGADAPAFDDVAEWLDALDSLWRRDDAPPAVRLPLISMRIEAATATTAYRRLGGALRTRGMDPVARLGELALAAAGRYAASRNLTVLHMVTGARAARVLARWLPADEAALDPLWHAVAAASLASGVAVPGAAPREPVARLDWDALRALACRQDDDHVVKLMHALWTIDATRLHPDGLRAAAVAVRG